jgi:excinuclease ABC subunit A
VQGGKVVAATTPERLAALPASHTGVALKPVLARGNTGAKAVVQAVA